MTHLENHMLEEIEFWERFISEWDSNLKGPLPRKALELLAFAEQKMDWYIACSEASVPTESRLRKNIFNS
ncbi:MAG: hypothetical protein GY703_25640 [Gammaproteobacteria bacterium]|nr:hypothetical protein [Gammaproteobacteria bacterium]